MRIDAAMMPLTDVSRQHVKFPDGRTDARSIFTAVPPLAGRFVRFLLFCRLRLFGSRVVSVLDSGAEGPGFKSQSRRCRVTVLGKLFTPVVPLFTKQQNW